MTDEVELTGASPEETSPVETDNVSIETSPEAVASEAPAQEYSDIELQAMEMGWKPIDQFTGDKSLFKSAEKFVEQKPLYDKIEIANRNAKQVQKLLQQTIEFNKKLAEQQKAKDLEILALKRKEAVTIGDDALFEEADKAYMEKLTEKLPVIETVQEDPLPEADLQEIKNFRERNKSWLNEATETGRLMTAAAKEMCTILEHDLPGRTTKEYLSMVEKNIKAAFPHKFKNEARSAPPAVNTGTRSNPSKASTSDLTAKLTPFQKHQMEIYVKSGGKGEEYLEQLKQLGRL